jgi:hypothetical protein
MHLQHHGLERGGDLVRAACQPMRAIVQTFESFPLISRQPAMHRLPADAPILCYLGRRATVSD